MSDLSKNNNKITPACPITNQSAYDIYLSQKSRIREINRIFLSNIFFSLLSFFLLTVIEIIFPSIRIPFRFYKRIYTLLNFSTAHFDFSKLFSYVIFLIFGFGFVNVVNLKNYRNNPLIGPNGYSDTKKVIIFGIIIFFVSSNFLLLGKFDFEGFCTKDKEILNLYDDAMAFYGKFEGNYDFTKKNENLNIQSNNHSSKTNNNNIATPISIDNNDRANIKVQNNQVEIDNTEFNLNKDGKEFHSYHTKQVNQNPIDDKIITENQNINTSSVKRKTLSFFKDISYKITIGLYAFTKKLFSWLQPDLYFREVSSDCKYPTIFERILSNYFFFILPFIIGLNFTYLDYIKELQKFTLSWEDMKNWGWDLWRLFIALCLFILFTISFLFYSLIKTSIYRFAVYIIFLIGLVLFIVIKTKKEKKNNKHFHLHHYALMVILNLLLGIHHEYFIILLGIFSGIMVEGCCRWGVSSCWNDD